MCRSDAADLVVMLRQLFLVSGLFVATAFAASYPGQTIGGWGYTGQNGPSNWPDLFPIFCAGDEQSPINIIPKLATPSTAGPIELHGFTGDDIPDQAQMDFLNNGHSLQVNLKGDYYIQGGPLKSTYQTAQFHFHWGSVDSQGSEHTVNGQAFPAEMHIVHWDRDTYVSINEAVFHKKGLAVLGVFLEIGDPNPAFGKLVDAIDKVKFKGDQYTMPEVFPLADLMPQGDDLKGYFFYEGSLTTPHCNEVVQWIVYKNPVQTSAEQLAALRSAYENTREEGETNTPLADNFRPTQPLNSRTLYVTGSNPMKAILQYLQELNSQ